MVSSQFRHTHPVGISHLVGCGGKATGAVVDPGGDIQPCLRAAEDVGMRIHFAIDPWPRPSPLGGPKASRSDRTAA